MHKFFGIFLILVIIGATAAVWFVVWQDQPLQEPRPGNGDIATSTPEEPEEINTHDWETYTNTIYGFSLLYPPEWQVHEAPNDLLTPKFNIYEPGSATSGLPFTHHSQNATHVSVYPHGIPTEGLSGEQRTSTVDFSVATRNARDYILDDGRTYATFANTGEGQENWEEAGFIFSGVPIGNHTFECFRDGEQIPNDECDPLTGDDVVHMGSINERDRRVVERILESFAFIQTTGTSTASYKDLIRVTSPLPESTVSSPLTIQGEARGQWYFEATFPIVLTDWDGRIIAEGYAEATDDWMTEEYVPFEATLTFTATTSVSNRGSLILQKSNASGLPEHDDAFEYTVYFEA